MIQPQVFGKFILLERVSVGGMAEVYRAKLLDAPNFERFFAIKRILPHLAKDTEFVTMFINEAKVAVELEHPNVCQILELGRLGQSHYIAMEYIAGRDVEAIQSYYRKQKKIMSVSQACFIMAQAAQGLDYAHRAVDAQGHPLGLVHRDVSPQNLIVTYDGVVKLIDFGVSKASRKTSHSKSGVVKGKFSYMSPEQATDGDIDHRSDIFALGVIFWELLTGRRLFQSESEFAIMEMISECKIEKPSKYNHTIPPAVERICMKALEKDVSKRYQWGSEMIMDLLDFINSCKTPFTQWHLQSWMCKVFADELDAEWKKIPIFKGINTEKDIEKYNKEHALTVAEGAPVAEARTEDSSALSDDVLSQISPSLSEKKEEKENIEEKKEKAEKPASLAESITSSPAKPKVPEKRTGPRIVEAKSKTASSGENPPRKEDSGSVKIEDGMPSMPPVPGRGPRIIGPSTTNPKIVKPKSSPTPELPEAKKEAEAEKSLEPPRLSIEAKPIEEEENFEFEPEEVAPEVSDPQLLKLQREEKKARIRKGLQFVIAGISILFIASPVLILAHIIQFPKEEISLPTSATLEAEVTDDYANPNGDDAETEMALYLSPKETHSVPVATAKGSQAKFDNLKAGEYVIDVTKQGFEPESYKLLLENKNYKTTLRMDQRTQEPTEYTIQVTPPDARVYINDELMPGTEAVRKYTGMIGTEYTFKILKTGYAPKIETIKLENKNSELNFDLGNLMPVSVTLDSSPRISEIFIKEGGGIMTRRGVTPLVIHNVNTTQPLEIEIRKPGHETWRRMIDFDKVEQTTDIRMFADLKPQ